MVELVSQYQPLGLARIVLSAERIFRVLGSLKMSTDSARISLINWNSLLADKRTSFVISLGSRLGHDPSVLYRIVMSS